MNAPRALKHALLASLCMQLFVVCNGVGAAPEEYDVKAAFLYNFASFTTWPVERGAYLDICLYGEDPFGTSLDALVGKRVRGRELRISRSASFEELTLCQVVFISGAAIAELPEIVSALEGMPILLVADSPGALQRGVVINLEVSGGRISFDANLLSAQSRDLELSSRMLGLAREVIQ
ncbi:MAG: YfiR family protein [Thiohalobacterales bacterium]|nr:YfiR family protein [Thiohalobacterales bacterium]